MSSMEDMALAILVLAKKQEDFEIRLGILRERIDRFEEPVPISDEGIKRTKALIRKIESILGFSAPEVRVTELARLVIDEVRWRTTLENAVVVDPWPLLDAAWGIIANVADGDWGRADVSSEWKESAERWRDEFHQALRNIKRSRR